MTDGISDGWHDAATLLAWTLGALPALFLLACTVTAITLGTGALIEWTGHRRRVAKLRREARRTGRAA